MPVLSPVRNLLQSFAGLILASTTASQPNNSAKSSAIPLSPPPPPPMPRRRHSIDASSIHSTTAVAVSRGKQTAVEAAQLERDVFRSERDIAVRALEPVSVEANSLRRQLDEVRAMYEAEAADHAAAQRQQAVSSPRCLFAKLIPRRRQSKR